MGLSGDTILFSEDGQREIADDMKKTKVGFYIIPIPNTVKGTYGSAIVNSYKEIKKPLEEVEDNE